MEDVKKILVVLPEPMGDGVLCGPALRRLRESLPGVRIVYLANRTVKEIISGAEWADGWLEWDGGVIGTARQLKKEGFEAAILTVNSFRSALAVRLAGIGRRIGYERDGRGFLLTTAVGVPRLPERFMPMAMGDYYQYLIGEALEDLKGQNGVSDDIADERLELFTGDTDREEIDGLLARWGLGDDKRLVILVPGGAYGPSKCWARENYVRLADKLSEDGYAVVLCCAPNEAEREIAREISGAVTHRVYSLAEEAVSLGGLKELVRRAALMAGNDTGPCHIAAAFGTPLVTLFGPTDPRWTATGYEGEIRLRCEVDCGPCQEKVCGRDQRCLNLITVEDVYDACRKQLEGRSAGEDSCEGKSVKGILTGSFYRAYEESFVPLRDGTGLVHKNYLGLLRRHGLGSLEGVFAYNEGEKLVKPGLGTRERLRVRLADERGRETVVYLKRYGRPGFGVRLRRRLSGRGWTGTGLYDFNAAVRLGEAGIAAPRPIAWGGQCDRWGEVRSYVMFEELPRAEALERLLPRWEEAKEEYVLLRDRKELIRQTAQLVRRLHGAGLYHRDLYLAHVFLSRDDDGGERLHLIDLQRVFRPRVVKGRWRVKDLAQLYYSARDYFSGADIMRFVQEYFETERLSAGQKRVVRAAARNAGRIERHERKKKRRGSGQRSVVSDQWSG